MKIAYQDILYEVHEGVARITINRPDTFNSFRGITCDELLDAFNRAGWNRKIGVCLLYTSPSPRDS